MGGVDGPEDDFPLQMGDVQVLNPEFSEVYMKP